MKTLDYFQLEINKTNPRDCNAISVKKIEIAASNDMYFVIRNDIFTILNTDERGNQARTLGEPMVITLTTKYDKHLFDLIAIEMYCHCSNRATFIRYCNEILAASADYSNYYVNALGDVMEITHDHD